MTQTSGPVKGAQKATRKRYSYPAHLRTSPTRTSYCHRCRREILTATYDALPLHLDPQPLTLLGEVDALLHGHTTWLVANRHPWKRNAWSIKTSPSGLGGAIHRTHNCERSQPTGAAVNFPSGPPSNEPGF